MIFSRKLKKKNTVKILAIHCYWIITTKSNNKVNNNNNDQGQLFWHASLKFHREALLWRSVFILKIKVKQAIVFVLHDTFFSFLSLP